MGNADPIQQNRIAACAPPVLMAAQVKKAMLPAGVVTEKEEGMSPWLGAAFLVVACLVAYANSFCGVFVFDDFLSIPQNPTLRHLADWLNPPPGGITVTGRPVLNLSFALNYAVSQNAEWSYHAVNLAIHIGAALVLYGVVRQTLVRYRPGKVEQNRSWGGRTDREATLFAFFSALLWAVHPLQTESVTYIVQRAESLMGLFYLLTLYCFIRGTAKPASEGAREEVPPPALFFWRCGAVLCCLLGMATKEVMVSAPVIVLAYDRTFVSGSFALAWKRHQRLHLALACTWGLLAWLVATSDNRGGSAGLGIGLGFWTYFSTQFEAVFHYLRLSLWPRPLILDYGAVWPRSFLEVAPYAAGAGLLLLLIGYVWFRRPVAGFLGLFFIAILAPTSVIPVARQTMAEHRMYLALIPPAAGAVYLVFNFLGRRSRWLVLSAAAVALGGATIARNQDYRSSETIWQDVVSKRPENAFAQNNYANILAESARVEAAVPHFQKAIELLPNYAEAHSNLGNALGQLRRPEEAIAQYEIALRLRPDLADAQTQSGRLLVQLGRVDEGLRHLKEAVRLEPHSAEIRNELGIALATGGQLPEATEQFALAVQWAPSKSDFHGNLGNAYRIAGRIDDCIVQYREALRLDPGFLSARLGLAYVCRDAGRLAEAIEQFSEVARQQPDRPELQNDLGVTLLMAGQNEQAISCFERALRLNPQLSQVRMNLAAALESVGRTEDAERERSAARRLDPFNPGHGN